MTTPALDRKLDKAFQQLDIDRDGIVEFDDLIALASRLFDGFGVSPMTPRGQEMLDSFEQLWQCLLTALDAHTDRRITAEEWRTGMTGAFVHPADGFEAGLRPAVRAVMRLADTDDDGRLTLDDFRVLQRAYGTAEPDIELAFLALDTHCRGSLTVDQLVEAARQYYTGAFRPGVGDWLYGRF